MQFFIGSPKKPWLLPISALTKFVHSDFVTKWLRSYKFLPNKYKRWQKFKTKSCFKVAWRLPQSKIHLRQPYKRFKDKNKNEWTRFWADVDWRWVVRKWNAVRISNKSQTIRDVKNTDQIKWIWTGSIVRSPTQRKGCVKFSGARARTAMYRQMLKTGLCQLATKNREM